MTANAIEVRDLTKAYAGRRVLKVERFDLPRGTIAAVVGPNGSGKTTLLSVLALLEPPTTGRIVLLGRTVNARNAAALRRHVVLVHEEPWMFATTALANVTYGLSARGVGRREARRRASAALDAVGMAEAADRPARYLSAGQRRRVALARALAVESEVLLLDEPMAGIDAQHADVIERALARLPREGRSVMLATHHLAAAYRLADRSLGLVAGRLTETPIDNHFAGTLVEQAGEPVMEIAPGCVVHVATDLRGPAHVVIDPRSVILSRRPARDRPAPPPSTARNTLFGRVAALAVQGHCVRVTVDVGVPMVAVVTEPSLREMGLALGQTVAVIFKAFSVAVYGGRGA